MSKEQLGSPIEGGGESEKKYQEQRTVFMKKLRDFLAGKSIPCKFLGLGEGWDDTNTEHNKIWAGEKPDNRPLTEKIVSFSSDGCYDNQIVCKFIDYSGQQQDNKLNVFQAAKIPEINDLALGLLDWPDLNFDTQTKRKLREEMPKVERFR